jgi:hypothetical protein
LLLGLSSSEDQPFDPVELSAGAGVDHGAALADLTRAAAARDDRTLARERRRIAELMSRDAMIDALAVYANFTMMTRIADGTGTPLDAGTAAISADMRASLGLNDLTSARL